MHVLFFDIVTVGEEQKPVFAHICGEKKWELAGG